jgi:hypothetical protein
MKRKYSFKAQQLQFGTVFPFLFLISNSSFLISLYSLLHSIIVIQHSIFLYSLFNFSVLNFSFFISSTFKIRYSTFDIPVFPFNFSFLVSLMKKATLQ